MDDKDSKLLKKYWKPGTIEQVVDARAREKEITAAWNYLEVCVRKKVRKSRLVRLDYFLAGLAFGCLISLAFFVMYFHQLKEAGWIRIFL
jgi:xanthine/uracil permease